MILANRNIKTLLSVALVAVVFIAVLALPESAGAQASSGDAPYNCYNTDGVKVSCPPASTYDFVIGRCYELRPENRGQVIPNEMDCPNSSDSSSSSQSTGSQNYAPNDCSGPDIKAGEPEGSENHCGILNYLVIITNFLAALVGIVVTGSIIFGGIQYSMAGSDPQKVQAAKDRIRNAVIALLFFIFTYAILNWLIPGGLF